MSDVTGPVTLDTLWRGKIELCQPARGKGYRFNLDPVLLAGFVEPTANESDIVVDLGAGCGVLGLLLLALGKARRVVAVEVQPQLAELAAQNGARNGHGETTYAVHCGDLRQLELPAAAAVVFNPPYFEKNAGRAAHHAGRDGARRELHGTLADFVDVAARLLSPGGSAYAIVPVARGDELATLFTGAGLCDIRSRAVCPRSEEAANHTMVAARAGAAGHRTEPPLIVHAGTGRDFTTEVQRLVDGGQQ